MSLTLLHFLTPGRWNGKGSFSVGDASRGAPMTIGLSVEKLQDGLHLEGYVDSEQLADRRAFSLNLQPDEHGTYELMLRIDGRSFTGVGKLATSPGLGLLWSADNKSHLTCTLFDIRGGHALRGLVHNLVPSDHVIDFELALAPLGTEVGSPEDGNVVSLASRRRPRRIT